MILKLRKLKTGDLFCYEQNNQFIVYELVVHSDIENSRCMIYSVSLTRSKISKDWTIIGAKTRFIDFGWDFVTTKKINV